MPRHFVFAATTRVRQVISIGRHADVPVLAESWIPTGASTALTLDSAFRNRSMFVFYYARSTPCGHAGESSVCCDSKAFSAVLQLLGSMGV